MATPEKPIIMTEPARLPAYTYPIAAERKLERTLNRYFNDCREMTTRVYNPILEEYKQWRPILKEQQQDDENAIFDPTKKLGSVSAATKTATNLVDDIAAGYKDDIIDIGWDINQWNIKQFGKYKKASPKLKDALTYEPGNIKQLVDDYADYTTSLIVKTEKETILDIEQIIQQGMLNGDRAETIAKKIQARTPLKSLNNPPYWDTRTRSRIIARDQVGKLNGKISQSRMQAGGISKYKWRTALDERVRGNISGTYPKAKPSHAAREGKIYAFNKPPEGGHPGHAILCRCWAEPYLGKEPAGTVISDMQTQMAALLKTSIDYDLKKYGLTGEKIVKKKAYNQADIAAEQAAKAEQAKDKALQAEALLKQAEEQEAKAIAKAKKAKIEAEKKKVKAEAAIQKAKDEKAKAEKIAKIEAEKKEQEAALIAANKAKIKAEKEAKEKAKAEAVASAKLTKEKTSDLQKALKTKDYNYNPDISEWEKVGAQAGSNPGGTYKDPTGQKWYVKYMDESHAINENMANQIYRELGIEVPDTMVFKNKNGDIGIVSKIDTHTREIGSKTSFNNLTTAQKKTLRDGYAADAFLANWDVGGMTYDNIMLNTKTGKIVRIDNGGALSFRAQGGAKAGKFTPDAVGELKTLQNKTLNPTTSHIFYNLTDEEKLKSIQNVIDNMSAQKLNAITRKIHKSAITKKAKEVTVKNLQTLKDRLNVLKAEAKLLDKQIKKEAAKNASSKVATKTKKPTVKPKAKKTVENKKNNHYEYAMNATIEERQTFKHKILRDATKYDEVKFDKKRAFTPDLEKTIEERADEYIKTSKISGGNYNEIKYAYDKLNKKEKYGIAMTKEESAKLKELKLIRYETGSGYESVNSTLRMGKISPGYKTERVATKKELEKAQAVARAIENNAVPTTEDIVLFRGADMEYTGREMEDLQGSVVTDYGVFGMTTGMDRDAYSTFNTEGALLKINVPKNTKLAWVKGASKFGRENEIHPLVGTRYRVDRVIPRDSLGATMKKKMLHRYLIEVTILP